MDAPMSRAVKSVCTERKMVQERSEAGEARPIEYIVKESQRPADAKPLLASPLPVVHLGQPDEAEEIKAALQSWGMFQVIDHGMPPSFLDEVRDVARAFFKLPVEEKKKYINIRDGMFGREGYGNDQVKVEGQILDWTDRLYLFVQPEDQTKPELWPTNPTSFRDVLHEFTMKTKKLVEDVLKTTAKSLELNQDSFESHLGDKFSILAKFNYYPCCSKPDLVFGVKPHSDGTLITVILPDKDVEGLQVMNDGEWITVTTSPHALIINIGDQMEIMSNGIFKSPVHRVVTFSDKDRISIAMFCANLPGKVIGPVDELVNDMRPRMYKNVKVKDYVEVFQQRFHQGKSALDWAQVL
ncbi:probable 2-oxoglutarate-dependent dioxygenase ANS [Dioscorea cayenensis subsp. rotundata]|uniref:Probable 2-oxoglutarate-dependent dioxygenase ANS n=1 Tax=Dioscorea cayennensis subsp. rotundata TaxID=55577 RepID=A0AB40AW64_DIOCR|nr:probable 2-oxoglutarate-dependent dioxygenase ANS [Dioscorea cayenensis subsp. rotundata]